MQTNMRRNGFYSSSNSWWTLPARLFALVASLASALPEAQANVYATDVRLNGRFAPAALYVPCGTVQISYILNEPASAGVTIDILNGATVVHSIVLAGGTPGTERGYNAVLWDAHDHQGRLVPLTTYTVRITAASFGHSDWTLIGDRTLNPNVPGNDVWDPVGIAVNQNTNSPYYGRVFVANASLGINALWNPGDRVGILKLNADGSNPPGGPDSSGIWNWAGDGFSPWKLEMGADDFLYVNDWSRGVALSFDPQLSMDSRRLVLRDDNRPAGNAASLSGPFLTVGGTNAAIWMADANEASALGVRRWPLRADGTVATNETGVTVVQAGGESALTHAPYDVAVDRSNRIFAIQFRTNAFDPAPRLLCFPPYTDPTLPLTNADWTVGSGNNSMRGASGVAVNPAGTLVAVAFRGVPLSGAARTGGRIILFDTADGRVVQTFIDDLGEGVNGDHTDVAWDNVGNLYGLDNYDRVWRVYSPPGSNAATTVATAPLVVDNPPLAPILDAVSYASGKFTLNLTGRTNISYVVEASTAFSGWLPVATNISHVCPTRSITVSAPAPQNFYRAYPLP